jgi:hypothetical protein
MSIKKIGIKPSGNQGKEFFLEYETTTAIKKCNCVYRRSAANSIFD